ncbi:tRNA-dihydrouridine synthase family protein [Opitutaceae bacterium LMO-CP1]|uniref:tRNA-dihydrouridine synthase n=1 Tax=Synoicihabitans lomoniglobus TaxID=2909285 RepID=A0AAF0CSC7_9BACT|nr:tRNA-dihydrouridine synthase family protein [Opitutaceae bacterium LMO-M01]WED67143.1 tRNA-dihydrouridine synthase family protein [Opitutaceae bacterium LMO-M01]
MLPLPAPILPHQPLTALAPMQDVTTLAFMNVVAGFGAPDYFVTEFFRVHDTSRLEKHIVRSIDENETGRPVFAQLIGESIPHLERTVEALLAHPIAGIDLNLGCPAPKVYKKNVGGGLLRDPTRVNEILRALRAACPGLFTVKMRIGFDDTAPYEAVLDAVAEHGVDMLAVHGRTVKEGYRSEVHYDMIARAVERVPCPVLANGNVTSAASAHRIVEQTGAAGVMIGRHAIRNPWIFRQCRELFAHQPVTAVKLADVYDYTETLFHATKTPETPELAHVNRMKKFLNFVGQGVDPQGAFLYDMRRTTSQATLFEVCRRHLLNDPEKPFADEPYPGVIARPNCETTVGVGGCSLDSVTA